MHIPKVVCIPCSTEMTAVKTGAVIEFAHSNGHKIKVSSDVYACPTCPAVTARVVPIVITEGWKPDYALTRAAIVARFAGDKPGKG